MITTESRYVTAKEAENAPISVLAERDYAVVAMITQRVIGWIIVDETNNKISYEAYTEAGKYIGFTAARMAAQKLVANQHRS